MHAKTHKLGRFAPLLLLAALTFLLTACPGISGNGNNGNNSGAPQISSFTANPGTIAAGNSALLSWTVTGSPTSLTISSSTGTSPGTVVGTTTTVSPTATTTYTLAATNSSGTNTAMTMVTVGGTTTGEDGLPPSGTFGVNGTQTGEFLNDASGNISSASDPRVVNVAPGNTFYAQVAYSDPGGIASVSIRIANSSPAGLGAPLAQGQSVGGFTLGAELTGCVLDGTQTAVSCVYPITVDAGTKNIDQLTDSEFAYVFRTNVTDAAGNVSDTPPRGYVTVGGSSGGGTPTPTPNPTPTPTPTPTPNPNPAPTAPKINSFKADPTSITSGQSSTLSWSISGTVTKLSIDKGVGDVTGKESASVSPTATTTYTLTASNGTASVSEQATVTVGDGTPAPAKPVISSFTANPEEIEEDGTSTLSWSVTDATSLSISPTVGTVTGTSTTVSPTETTEYTLTATNSTGSTTAKVTVAVDTEEPEGNKAQVEKLLGNWTVTYSIGSSKFTDNFSFSRLLELLPGEFVAVGSGEAQGGYHVGDEFIDAGYYFYDPPANEVGTSQSYNFTFTSNNSISGYTFLSPFLRPSSDRYKFTGVRG